MPQFRSTPASAAAFASDLDLMDQRAGERFGIALPVMLEDGAIAGATLDLSETGILFETAAQAAPAVGATIGLSLQFALDGREYRTRCDVEVVRVERVGDKVNVAARLLAPLDSGH
jgi:hypothetical protein